MTDDVDVGLACGLADVPRRDLLAAVACNPHIRRLYLESLAADLQALTAAEIADTKAGATVLPFNGGDVSVE